MRFCRVCLLVTKRAASGCGSVAVFKNVERVGELHHVSALELCPPNYYSLWDTPPRTHSLERCWDIFFLGAPRMENIFTRAACLLLGNRNSTSCLLCDTENPLPFWVHFVFFLGPLLPSILGTLLQRGGHTFVTPRAHFCNIAGTGLAQITGWFGNALRVSYVFFDEDVTGDAN